ncbi:MAG: acyl carrier protein [Pseudomonadota bacterium]
MAISHSDINAEAVAGVREVLRQTLQLGARADQFEPATPLLGQLPELDSMAVASVLAGLEEQFDIYIEDEDISADDFSTFGSLCRFVNEKAR